MLTFKRLSFMRIPLIPPLDSGGIRHPVPVQSATPRSERSDVGFLVLSHRCFFRSSAHTSESQFLPFGADPLLPESEHPVILTDMQPFES